jgi:hypothetical protein
MHDSTESRLTKSNPSSPAYLSAAIDLRDAARHAAKSKSLLRRVAADAIDGRQIQLLRDLDEIISHVEASITHLAVSRELSLELQLNEPERTAA